MRLPICHCMSLACLFWSTQAFGQETPATPPAPPEQAPPAAAATAPAPAKSPLTQWGTDFSFMFDGYVDKNFNDPPSGFNGLRNFDVRSDTAHVNMGMITIDHAPAPVGFHLDVGFGETFDIIQAGLYQHQAESVARRRNRCRRVCDLRRGGSHRDQPEL